MATNIDLPEGFVLDNTASNSNLPEGFVLDNVAVAPDNRGTLRKFLEGIPQGLGNVAVGATQTVTDFVDPEAKSQFSRNLAKEVSKLKQKQSELPTAEKAGVFAGEVAPFLSTRNPIIGGGIASGLSLQEDAGLANRAIETGEGALISGVTAGLLNKGSNLIAKGFGLLKPKLKPKINKEAVEAFKTTGIKPTLADVADDRTTRGVQSFLSNVPGSSSVLEKARNETLDDITNQLTKIESSLPVTKEQAGGIIQKGAKNFVDRFKNVSSKLYDRLDKYIKPTEQVAIPNLSKTALEEIDKFSGTPALQERLQRSQAGRIIHDIIADTNTGNGQLPYQVLKKYRSIVGHNLGDQFTIGNEDRALLKKVYGALTEDMKAAVSTKGKNAELAFNNANKFYAKGIEDIENNLQKIINSNLPEEIFKQAFTGTKEGGTKIRNIFRALNPEEQGIIRSTFINKIGINNKTGEFVPAQFINSYNQISPEAKSVIFTNVQRNSLDNLSKVIKRISESGKTNNFSNTTPQALLGFLGVGALSGNLASIGSGLGIAHLSAKLMTNPKFINWLAKTPSESSKLPAHIKKLSIIASQDPDLRPDIRSILQNINIENPQEQ